MNARKVLSLTVFALLAGCGGTNATFRGATPFVGFYQGTWLEPSTGLRGATILTVDGNAVVQGTINGLPEGASGAIVAHTDVSGGLRGNIRFAPGAPEVPFHGSMALRPVDQPPTGIGGTLFTTGTGAQHTIQFSADRL